MSAPLPGYEQLDGLALAEQVRTGEVSALELVRAAEARIAAWEPHLNARVHDWSEEALREAEVPLPDGPFRGVPYLLKNLLSTWKDREVTHGSRFFRGLHATEDDEIVRRYRASGAVCLGRTNSPELGLLPVTEPEAHGASRNPWNPGRTPGGSSGGSAALVAAGCVPFAAGGDGGGSIRIPASCCGIFGLKPTRGRTPSGPRYGALWHGLAVQHALTRSVRDSAALLDVLSGREWGGASTPPPPERPFLAEVGDPPGRLSVAWTGRPLLGTDVDPECLRGLAATVELLDELGHRTEEVDLPLDREAFSSAFVTMICAEVAADLEDAARAVGRRPGPGDVESATWALALLGRRLSAADLSKALRTLHRTAHPAALLQERFDVLLTPTLASPPPPLGSLDPTPVERLFLQVAGRLQSGGLLQRAGMLNRLAGEAFRFTPFTPVANVTGQPAMSVPLHRTPDGLPVGMHFVGRFGGEATLLRLAARLEEAAPWRESMPPWPPATSS